MNANRLSIALVSWVLLAAFTGSAAGTKIVFPNAGFEDGLAAPWGTGQYAAGRPVWWNSGGCQSTARIDTGVYHSGAKSLHIVNPSGRAPHVYGTTQQPLPLIPGRKFRISVWAKARDLADGAVSIIVDRAWQQRPIRLPGGTYDWTLFSGTFTPRDDQTQVRILIEDRGEVWLDDFSVTFAEPRPQGSADSSQGPPAQDSRRALLEALAQFHWMMVQDYHQALDRWATPEVKRRFQQFDEYLWPETPPRMGWSYFVNVSAVSIAGTQQEPLVAWYHPWSDVFLLAEWGQAEGHMRVQDVEVVMGDVLRHRGRFPRNPEPLWVRTKLFPPAAVGLSVVESIRSFELLLQDAQGDWRGRLANLASSEIADLNYLGASELLQVAMDRIDVMRAPHPEEKPQLARLRAETARVVKLAAEGQIDELLRQAPATLPAMKPLLAKTPSKHFRTLTVVSTLVGPQESYVFLSSTQQPGYYLSLTFHGQGQGLRLHRLDVVVYNALYRHLLGPHKESAGKPSGRRAPGKGQRERVLRRQLVGEAS